MNATNISEMSLVPLQQAALCLDCEMITSAQTHCFACGSVALMSLARTLNGHVEETTPLRADLFVMRKKSPRRKEPAAFTSLRASQDFGFRAKYADLRKVLSSVLVRPLKHA
jgi:hypothetical protein